MFFTATVKLLSISINISDASKQYSYLCPFVKLKFVIVFKM